MGLLDSFPRQDSKRQLTVEEKLEAIRRVTDLGETKASVSRMYGVPESTLRGWCKNKDKLNTISVNQTRGSSEVKKRSQSEPNVGRYEGLLMTAGSPRSPEPKKLKLELDMHGFSEAAGVETSAPPAAHSNCPPLQPLQISPAAAINLSSLFAIYCAQTGNQPVQNNAEEPLSLVKRPSPRSEDRTENYSSSSEDSQNSCRFSMDGDEENNQVASNDALKAIKHGEQFLRWLEGVSDPSITRLQLFQFRCLLEKVKTASFSRKIKSNPTETT